MISLPSAQDILAREAIASCELHIRIAIFADQPLQARFTRAPVRIRLAERKEVMCFRNDEIEHRNSFSYSVIQVQKQELAS